MYLVKSTQGSELQVLRVRADRISSFSRARKLIYIKGGLTKGIFVSSNPKLPSQDISAIFSYKQTKLSQRWPSKAPSHGNKT
jgi:hypothetical protein